jgi:NAD-dependent deacetylase
VIIFAAVFRRVGDVTTSIDVTEVAGWVADAARVTVLTGAGVSTGSGIPDFRGPNGLWTRNPDLARMFSIDEYVRDPQLRVQAWINRRDHPAWTAQPNPGHRALVELERSGRLRALLTQNIDGLHQRAGSTPDLVLELHGTLFGVECLQCSARTTMEEALARVAAGEDDPPCLVCGGIQKAATISFGQALRADVLDAAVRAAADCEVFLAVGTSLQVQPAAGLCEIAVSRGARLVIVNADPTPYDGLAAALVRGEISDALPALLAV